MNIVYGGSFNPPTLAHKAIVDLLIDSFKPDNLIIIPTGNSYDRKEMLDFSYRYEMSRLAFPSCIISDVENHNEKYMGTLDTLNKLSDNYDDIYFVMGADNILGIKTWIRWEELLKNYNFIIMRRDSLDIDTFINNELKEYKNHFKIIDIDYKISSTRVRDDIKNNKDLIDDKVYEYIIRNNLY